MNDTITIDEIISFIRYYLDDYKIFIGPETRLQQDLRIYGYDAEDFFLACSKKFKVDLKDINLNEHFLGEGGIWKPWLWGQLNVEDQSDKKPFTVLFLHSFINHKKNSECL